MKARSAFPLPVSCSHAHLRFSWGTIVAVLAAGFALGFAAAMWTIGLILTRS